MTHGQADSGLIAELYDELATIGRKDKSIQPSAFVAGDGSPKYPAILSSQEVRRRAKLDASSGELAAYARQAILDGIAMIYVPSDRLAAEVALCAREEYQGLTVKERTSLLLEKGVTPDIYKRRRRTALRNIARFLLQDQQSSDLQLAHSDNIAVLHQRLQELAQSAANFHVAGLLMHLVNIADVTPITMTKRRHQMGEPAEYLLYTYAELHKSIDRLFSYPQWTPRIYLEEINSALNPIPTGRACEFKQETYQEAKNRFDSELRDFYLLDQLITFRAHAALINILRSIPNYDPFIAPNDMSWIATFCPKPFESPSHTGDLQLEAPYTNVWTPWYEKNAVTVQDRLTTFPASVPILCAKSGAVVLILETHFDKLQPVMRRAADMAVRALPYYYGLSPTIMLDDGTKVDDTEYAHIAERYFSKSGRDLAKSYLALYGSHDYGILREC